MNRAITLMAALFLLTACQTTGWDLKAGQENLANNTVVTVKWGDGKRYYCKNSTSPRIEATNAPVKGVANVRVWLVDLDYVTYPHDGAVFPASEVLDANGNLTVAQDAVANAPGSSYQAPCSTIGPHKYQFTLYFLDKEGVLLGKKAAAPSPAIP